MLGMRPERELEKRLEAIVSKTGRSKSYSVREAIRDQIEDWANKTDDIAVFENFGRRWTLNEIESGIHPKANDLEA
jgi:predicted DNA-binding protein